MMPPSILKPKYSFGQSSGCLKKFTFQILTTRSIYVMMQKIDLVVNYLSEEDR